MNLNFSPKKPFTFNGQTQYIREAQATPEFWAKWRFNKNEMSALGIQVIDKTDDIGKKYWIVRQITTSDGNGGEKPLNVVPVPVRDRKGLLPYQISAVSQSMGSLLSNNIVLDASDTGTGKTYVALKTLSLLGYRPAIVCIKNSIRDWKIVCAKYNLNPFFIYNWESCIGRIFRKNKRIHKITQPPNKYIKMDIHPYSGKAVYFWRIPRNLKVCVIFDEIHLATGNGSHNQSLVMAAKDFPIMALSATLADKLERFETLGERLGLYKENGFDAWMMKQGYFVDRKKKWTGLHERESMLQVSKHIFPNYGVRIKKDNLKDFPEVQNIARLVECSNPDRQNNAFQKLIEQIRALKEGKQTENTELALRTRYRQMAELNKVPVLIELVKEYIDNGFSVCVFVNYDDTLRRLAKHFKTDMVIHGNQKNREEIKQRFQANTDTLLILNGQAGGTSINLHDLHGGHPRVSIICPSDNSRQIVQICGRIHRAGAKTKAMNVLVYAAKTIEEKVFENVSRKINNINTLNDGDLAETDIFNQERE